MLPAVDLRGREAFPRAARECAPTSAEFTHWARILNAPLAWHGATVAVARSARRAQGKGSTPVISTVLSSRSSRASEWIQAVAPSVSWPKCVFARQSAPTDVGGYAPARSSVGLGPPSIP